MTQKLFIITVAVIAAVAGSAALGRGKGDDAKAGSANARQKECQYNICLLLDLSDRIDPRKDPLQAERDRKMITATVGEFGELVKRKLYVNSHDTMRVAVAPQPNDYRRTLLDTGDHLAIDMRSLKVSEKRTKLPQLKEQLLIQSSQLYDAAVKNSSFAGGDIWSFFRDSLESYRIDDGKRQVRNILVVLTDGYITFDSNSGRPREGKRTSWMEVARMRHSGWEQEFDRIDSGLLPAGKNHGAWEVLVLETAPQTPQDMPVIRKYWSKWLSEMGISHYRIEQQSDSASLEKDAITSFLKERPAAQEGAL